MKGLTLAISGDVYISRKEAIKNYCKSHYIAVGEKTINDSIEDTFVTFMELRLPYELNYKKIINAQLKLYVAGGEFNGADGYVDINLGMIKTKYSPMNIMWDNNLPFDPLEIDATRVYKKDIYSYINIDITEVFTLTTDIIDSYIRLALFTRGKDNVVVFSSSRGDNKPYLLINYEEKVKTYEPPIIIPTTSKIVVTAANPQISIMELPTITSVTTPISTKIHMGTSDYNVAIEVTMATGYTGIGDARQGYVVGKDLGRYPIEIDTVRYEPSKATPPQRGCTGATGPRGYNGTTGAIGATGPAGPPGHPTNNGPFSSVAANFARSGGIIILTDGEIPFNLPPFISPIGAFTLDATRKRIIVNIAGLYMINTSFTPAAGLSSYVMYALFVNGIAVTGSNLMAITNITTYATSPVTATNLVLLNANDVVTIKNVGSDNTLQPIIGELTPVNATIAFVRIGEYCCC